MQATQVRVAIAQTGVTPPHWLSFRQATQTPTPDEMSQRGADAGQCETSVAVQGAQAPLGRQIGAAGPHSASDAQARHARAAPSHTGFVPPHSPFVRQPTQRARGGLAHRRRADAAGRVRRRALAAGAGRLAGGQHAAALVVGAAGAAAVQDRIAHRLRARADRAVQALDADADRRVAERQRAGAARAVRGRALAAGARRLAGRRRAAALAVARAGAAGAGGADRRRASCRRTARSRCRRRRRRGRRRRPASRRVQRARSWPSTGRTRPTPGRPASRRRSRRRRRRRGRRARSRRTRASCRRTGRRSGRRRRSPRPCGRAASRPCTGWRWSPSTGRTCRDGWQAGVAPPHSLSPAQPRQVWNVRRTSATPPGSRRPPGR